MVYVLKIHFIKKQVESVIRGSGSNPVFNIKSTKSMQEIIIIIIILLKTVSPFYLK